MTSLQVMVLRNNLISGTLSPEWGANGSFPAIQYIDFTDNTGLKGSLPAWGSGGAMQSLYKLRISNCSLSGTLPEQIGSDLPSLTLLYASHNRFSGTLPAAWSQLDIQQLSLEANRLTGTLPSEWGLQWPNAYLLYLSNNSLQGTLPPAWAGLVATVQKTSGGNYTEGGILDLAGCNLSGTIPANWTGNSVALFPGNPGLCGPLPSAFNYSFFDNDKQSYFQSNARQLSPCESLSLFGAQLDCSHIVCSHEE
ncbi:hypothetical protein WJX73_000464 [Symbiochloris irregularis]|uniref:GP46-like surface antigen n=1 Tax=Symbiochloris irregularis TaxID=706552 RepID=A0AAW1NMA3_9CHLO